MAKGKGVEAAAQECLKLYFSLWIEGLPWANQLWQQSDQLADWPSFQDMYGERSKNMACYERASSRAQQHSSLAPPTHTAGAVDGLWHCHGTTQRPWPIVDHNSAILYPSQSYPIIIFRTNSFRTNYTRQSKVTTRGMRMGSTSHSGMPGMVATTLILGWTPSRIMMWGWIFTLPDWNEWRTMWENFCWRSCVQSLRPNTAYDQRGAVVLSRSCHTAKPVFHPNSS